MQRKNRLAVFEHVPHKERLVKNAESKTLKRARSPETSFEDNNPRNLRRRKKGIPLTSEPLMLKCDYSSCDFYTEDYYDFLKHIDDHYKELNPLSDTFDCLWDGCTLTVPQLYILKQHLSFHGYHTKLKNIGKNMLERMKLPACNEIIKYKVGSSTEFYICEWDHCNIKFSEYPFFLDHVKCHVNGNPKSVSNKNEVIRCGWTGCSNTYPIQHKLQDHVRTHTKEKVLACPDCDFMFASKTKFSDHRKRQLPIDLKGYQCSQCSKQFPSERLLRDHMRMHINHYKCHLCDMTCPKPSMLARHIRYRHLPDRPFKCEICNHSTITSQDLMTHQKTHNSEKTLECKKCNFKCRSKWAFERHQTLQHENGFEQQYACHCCHKIFTRGGLLTRHLIKVHDFHWPSGHSRFLYKQDLKTGLYHLQVVRYESLEVTQEMIQCSEPFQHAKAEQYKFVCEQNEGKPLSYVLKLSYPSIENSVVDNSAKPSNTDGNNFNFESTESDDPNYASDDTDALVICNSEN